MKNQVRLPAHIKPERYQIMLRPNLEDFTFYGEETIYLTLEKPAKQITLHAVELKIESMEFIHQNKEVQAGKISYNSAAETAAFTFPKPLPAGKGKLKLTFTGVLNDKMRGFYRSKYHIEDQVRYLATTQFESTDARRAFPCFDEPSQKAIFDVTLMIPAKTVAISNTIPTEVLEHDQGYQIIKFAPTPKMSTYLLAFIVGDFESIEGKTKKGKVVRVFTTPGKKDQAGFALDVAKKCLDFYEDYFGIDYPLPVLDLVAIPDFAAGAMENWGAMTYRESTLLVDEERSSTANKQWVALVIAHEIAHQWFGDLVTMEWWTHLWLNEGFASFIEYLAIDHIFPDWDIWTQFVSSELGSALELDSLKNTHPIEVPVHHPAEIAEIFDKVSYSKGAAVLRMLMWYLGEKDFQKGLQLYLKKFAYSNARTEDLWACLEEVSKKPVTKVMNNWVLKPGHPMISVKIKDLASRSEQRSKIELTQSRFFASPISKKEAQDNTLWQIPIRMGDKQIIMDKKNLVIPNTEKKLNTGEVSLVRVDYPHQYLKELESKVQTNSLAAPDRLGLIRDSFDLAKSGNSPTTLALELTQSYITETDYTVWLEITSQFAQVDHLLAYEDFYHNFQSYGRKIYAGIAQKLGWEKKKGETHTDAILRGMVLYQIGHFGDQEVVQTAKTLFGKANIDPDLRSTIYNLIAENGSRLEFNMLLNKYKQEENQQEKDRIGRALGLFKSKTLLQKTLQFAISKHVRYQNSLQIIAAVWVNSQGRYLAWEFVKKNWQMLKSRYAGGHYFTRVFSPAGQFTKKTDAKEIEKFVAKHPVPEAKRTIAQVLEQIYSNSEWLKRDKSEIKNFLDKILI